MEFGNNNKKKESENREEIKQELREKKEEFRQEFREGTSEIKSVIETTIDPNGDKQISLGEILGEMFNIHKDVASKKQIDVSLREGGRVSGTNMCLLVLAILIASIGLNVNSTAVIIGAMLISPLMGTIQATAYGTAISDSRLTTRSIMGFLTQVFISLCASTIYFLISPLSTQTSELLARTQPTIWDVLIAICGGLAGIIGVTRKEKTNVIPGVAIATALMPPLCTCGYSLAHGQWKMLLGAGYLFMVNTYFIFLSATIILAILGVPKVQAVDPKKTRKLRIAFIRNSIIIIIPSFIFAWNMVSDSKMEEKAAVRMEISIDSVELSNEVTTLFPEIASVGVGSIHDMNESGELVEKKVILLTLKEEKTETDHSNETDSEQNPAGGDASLLPITKEQKDRIILWLQGRYPEYEVRFQNETK